MGESMLNTKMYNLLIGALDGSALKQAVISNNIANVNTPGYKKNVVNFQEVLENMLDPKKELVLTRAKHLAKKEDIKDTQVIKITQNNATSLRNDGNNVDVDLELAELAENNLYFNSLTQLLSSQLAMIKYAISEGRR